MSSPAERGFRDGVLEVLEKQANLWPALAAGALGVGGGLGAGYALWGRKNAVQPEAQPQATAQVAQDAAFKRQEPHQYMTDPTYQYVISPQEMMALIQQQGQGAYEVPGYAMYF